MADDPRIPFKVRLFLTALTVTAVGVQLYAFFRFMKEADEVHALYKRLVERPQETGAA